MNGLPDASFLPAWRGSLSCLYQAAHGPAVVAAVATGGVIIRSLFDLVHALSELPFVSVSNWLPHQLKKRFEYACAGIR